MAAAAMSSSVPMRRDGHPFGDRVAVVAGVPVHLRGEGARGDAVTTTVLHHSRAILRVR